MLIVFFLLFCSVEEAWPQDTSRESTEQLSARVCGSCHSAPTPDLLDKRSWRDVVLPRMGTFLGIYPKGVSRASLIEKGAAETYITSHNIYPEIPTIDAQTWKRLRSYYVDNAPKKLPNNSASSLTISATFNAVRPAFSLQPPSTTFVNIDDKTGSVTIGDAVSGKVFSLTPQLAVVRRDSTGEAPAWITSNDDARIATIMGSFSPTDAPTGKVVWIPSDPKRSISEIITGLQRPVHHAVADLDGNGENDIVICEFGKWTGGLSWWKCKKKGEYERIPLREGPGATRVEIRDWNRDGRLDVIALFAQGNENITAFINNGDGTFAEETVLQFPPSWGSSYFAIQDIDTDGDNDIIHCAGDNADFGPLLRPYHGVRIFFNNGKNQFPDTVFLPLHGAYSAIAADFDLDGDTDISAISFFPDHKEKPVRGFVYYENEGRGTYKTSTFPEVGAGRWIVMDSGDIDHDGDLDLILGSLVMEVKGRHDLVDNWVKNAIPFVILENRTR